jgi:hypothetical protein
MSKAPKTGFVGVALLAEEVSTLNCHGLGLVRRLIRDQSETLTQADL